jgi:superfamily II DNA or RNA helicase
LSTRFFTNEGANTLLKKFEGVFTHNPDIRFFDALVGFFRASGYFAVRPHLGNVPHIRVLVGINVDSLAADAHAQGLLFQGDPGRAVDDFVGALKNDIQEASYTREVEDGVRQFIEDVASEKLEIRAHPSRKLHAKIYIFRPENFNEHHAGYVITGSSNLTDAGLGTTESANYEFNVLLNNYDDVKFAGEEFEKLWTEGIPILPVEVNKARQETFLNDEFTPFEVYMKFLIEYFGRSVEFDPNSVSDLPSGFKRLTYQIDAVNQGFEMLRRHGGFFLADVVGLGKTVVAILIAKKYFYTNGYPAHNSRTLIVVPPALKVNWEETIEQFGLPNYRIVHNGSLHKIANPENYDLVIVDEAHKFRNDTAEGHRQLQALCKTPTRRILPDGRRARKAVILVSATPLNNRPEDIRNLVYLFQDARDSSLSISNLNAFFAKRIDEYRRARKLKDMNDMQAAVSDIYGRIREHVIAPLTVRRTRTDLRENRQYLEDLARQGITFPETAKPRKVLYQLNPGLELLYDQTMQWLAHPERGLTYNRYRAVQYLVPGKKLKYANADMLSLQLAKIMRTLLVKRLDSSFHAFRASLTRFQQANEAMVRMFEANRVVIAPNLNVNEYILDEREDELLELVAEMRDSDPTIEVCAADDFQPGFYDGLKHDQEVLETLVKSWAEVDEDPKLNEFLARLSRELLDKSINPEGKLVVFSESWETSHYLWEQLCRHGFERTLCVHAANRKQLRPQITANFDANIEASKQADDYDILISTEVLSEGVNLHRANVIVNYDTPWNSTRLMQRLGRINRIGSVAPKVYNYVFYPTAKVDNDIELHKRAIMKLQAFHSALGEDSQIYSQAEEVGTFGLFDRDQEEERDESLALLMELREFKNKAPARFRQIRNMPLRARTGRHDKTKPGTTIAFVRNQHRDAFYFVGPEGGVDELTFVQCARQFEAKPSEHSIGLHDRHHEQITLAVRDFSEKLQQELATRHVVDVAQGPQEKKALSFLDACANMPMVGAAEKQLIEAGKRAVRLGKFQQLVRDINRLQKTQQKQKNALVVVLDAVIEILGKYPVGEIEETAQLPAQRRLRESELKPEIIISESFAGGR